MTYYDDRNNKDTNLDNHEVDQSFRRNDHDLENNTSHHQEEQASTEIKNTITTTESRQPKTSKATSKNSIWAMLISGIVGGVVVGVLGLVLISTGTITLDSPTANSETPPETATSIPKSSNTEDRADSTNVIPTVATDNSTNSLSGAIQRVSDAVVGISNIRQAGLWAPTQESGTGSGVIYKKENGSAYVVTNNHVVEGASDVEVILTSGEHVNAKVLGADELTDLAVLEIDGSKVEQVAPLGSSSRLTVGDTAIAIGNPLGTEFAGSVTKGIISGLERSVEMDLNGDRRPDWTTEVIQTDAAINPGNSGGALINIEGEVIGINSMKIAKESVEGIGFAIPIDEAKPIIEQLESDGKVSRPFVGISAVSLSTVPTMNKQQTLKLGDEVTEGVVLAEVQPGSPADSAGLQRYDVITKINDQSLGTMMDLKQYLYSETSIGDEVSITYYREGTQQTTSLTLSEQ